IEYGKQHSLEVRGLSIDDDGELNIEFIHDNDLMFSNRMARVYPELRPMSDLIKEIEHNGERFVPIEEISKFTTTEINHHGEIESYEFNGNKYVTRMPDDMDWYRLQKLFEWHFDVFGLIKEGLAVDLNEVKK